MKKFVSLIAVGSLFISQLVWGTTLISLPNTYSSDTTIKSAEVNQNEQHVQSQVNTHNATTTGEHGVTGTIAGTGGVRKR